MDISDLPVPPKEGVAEPVPARPPIQDLPRPQPADTTMLPFGAQAGMAIMSGAAGAMKPLAGLAQWFGMNKPARTLEDISRKLEEIGGLPMKAADIAGQVMSPIPIKGGQAAMSGLQRIAPAVERAIEASPLTKAALQGAGMAALTPTEGEFLEEKPKQIAEGALIGGGLGKASQLLMAPRVSPAVQEMKDLGVSYFTPGQLATQIPVVGEGLRKLESAATSVPMAGPLIERGTRKVHEQFNRAIADKVLAPMGEKVPKQVSPGEEMVAFVNQKIENAYDNITPMLQLANARYPTMGAPGGFTTTVKNLNDRAAQVAQGLPSAQGNNLAGMVRQEFEKYIINPLMKGSMTGQEFRDAEKNLGRVAFNYMKNPQYHDVGVALRELQADLRKELAKQNPAVAKELQAIHQSFRRHLPYERAASYVGAEGRVFSPSQLESAIKAETKGKGQFASGKGLMYPETQAALEVLGRKIPDSGTAQRVGTAAGLLTLPAHYQASLPVTAAAAGMYNVPAMKALTTLATERPELLRKIEEPVSGALSRFGGMTGAQ